MRLALVALLAFAAPGSPGPLTAPAAARTPEDLFEVRTEGSLLLVSANVTGITAHSALTRSAASSAGDSPCRTSG